MQISYLFAGLAVTDLEESIEWYSRLLGRSPTFRPNDREAVWQVASGVSAYIVADPSRAGNGLLALLVADLAAELSTLAAKGIDSDDVEQVGTEGRKAVIRDPDGNDVSLIELSNGGSPG
jgi:catechol 2,3-dioxygenase-like lactoylglutathione lyase family enzyme